MTKLSAAQERVLALIAEHGTITRKRGGGCAVKGFNYVTADALAAKGLVVATYTDAEMIYTLATPEAPEAPEADETPAADESNPEHGPAAHLPEAPAATSWTVEYRVRTNGFGGLMRNSTSVKAGTPAQALAIWFGRATSTENLYDVSAYREGSGQGSANWHEGDPIPAEGSLRECRGDWTQRGRASGKPSVHRVTTHGETRDACAYHSPFDVDDAHPVGWVQPEDYWPTDSAPAPASSGIQAHFGGWASGSMAPAPEAPRYTARHCRVAKPGLNVSYRQAGGEFEGFAVFDHQAGEFVGMTFVHHQDALEEAEEMNRKATLEAGTASVPAGGYPSPFAVAFLASLVRGNGRWVPSRGELAEAEELEGRGFVVKIPGLQVRAITEAGREFTWRWILASPASS